MAKKKKEKKVGIKILGIREISFSNNLSDEILDKFTEKKVISKLSFSVKGDSKKNTVKVNSMVNYLYSFNAEREEIDFMKLETETVFKLFEADEEDIKFDDKEDKLFISDDLMKLFLTTSFGATRGMLAYKMASLPINLVMPIVDISSFIDNHEDDEKNA